MAAPFNYQIFNNVTDRETFLNNIRNVASNNGWTIDKDDIANNQELYLHSTGNGNQNLYFSMKVQDYIIRNGSNLGPAFYILGNTGFDTNSAWDSQPGRYSELYIETNWSNPDYALIPYLYFPISKQYILANSQMVIILEDMVNTHTSTRLVGHQYFGAIDTYNPNDSEGNVAAVYLDARHSADRCSALFGIPSYNDKCYGLLYKGENKFNEDKLGVSTFWNSYGEQFEDNIGQLGYQYRYAVQFNDWASRTSLIKPIVSIKDTTSTDVYFYPIGELPYYACKAYPYYKAGDIITQGTRNFMIFPLFSYTYGNGVAIEVNT